MLKQKHQQLATKKGEPRKRTPFALSKKEREIVKIQIKEVKRCVKKSCKHKNCMSAISEKRRREINSQFWTLSYAARATFVHSTISRVECARRRPNSKELRGNTFSYQLKNETGQLKNVCKIFYLTTLGYSKSNDSFIRSLLGRENFKKPLRVRSEQGKHTKTPKINRDIIIQHINSFNPNISHHRRVHAPKKKYLPSDITITAMYTDFNNKYPGMCSYDVYRQIVSVDLNISFAHLGNEECESCERFMLHTAGHPTHTKENPVPECDDCTKFVKHRKKYIASRQTYEAHQKLCTADHHRATADLQKVVMLPRMDMFKEVIFCPRLIAFNESFVPIGDNNKAVNPLAVVWHEAISGRKKEDIISTFYKYFLTNSEVKKFTLFLDNCSAQNKNWTLFGFLIHLINSDAIEAEFIEFIYFEPGHTFMSADYFHHQVEQSLKMMKKVYDFENFRSAVQKANSQNVAIAAMTFQDFYNWPTYHSYSKINKAQPRPYIADIVYVRAERGSKVLKYKTDLSSEQELVLDFLQVKYMRNDIPLPPTKSANRGILKSRKQNIINRLGSLLGEKHLPFWENLPETTAETQLHDDD